MLEVINIDDSSVDLRIDKWIKNNLSKIPQSLIEKDLRNGKIKVNKKKVKSSYKLKKNDKIFLYNVVYKTNIISKKIYVPNNVFIAPWNCVLMEYQKENIEVMKINPLTLNIDTSEVITVLKPVVVKAEITSKTILSNCISLFNKVIKNIYIRIISANIIITTIEWLIVSWGIFFLQIVTLFLPLKKEKTAKANTTNVVIFIPPATEAGAPPINIKISVINKLNPVRSP